MKRIMKQGFLQSIMDKASSAIRNIKLYSLKNQIAFESRFLIIQSSIFGQCRTNINKDDLRIKQFL